jgi:hypothetical protein
MAVAIGWSRNAHASGHGLSGLGAFLVLPAVLLLLVWGLSWWMLVKPASTGRWLGGTLAGAAFLPAALFLGEGMSYSNEALVVVFAVFPSLLHQAKLIGHYAQRRRHRSDDVV